MINYGNEKKGTFSKFERKRDILEDLMEYEKYYMDILKKYEPQISFINGLLKELRDERTDFISNILPSVQKKLEAENIDKKTADKWISEFKENAEKSYEMSEAVIKHFVTKNLEEFRYEMQKAVDGGIL